MSKNRLTDLVLISAGPGLLLLGSIFDYILRRMTPPDTSATPLTSRQAYLFPLFELLLMLAVVALIWRLVANRTFSRLVPSIFLLLGVIFLYAFPLYFTAYLPESWTFIALYLTPYTYLFQAAGALAALGLVTLWFWKAPQPVAPAVPPPAPFAAPVFTPVLPTQEEGSANKETTKSNETTNLTDVHE